VTADSSNRLTLAYLTRATGDSSWKLRVAPLFLEEGTGIPLVPIAALELANRELANDLVPTPLAFSTDGQVIFASAEGGRIKTFHVRDAAEPILSVGSALWHAR